ncbi:hypothetical protein ACT9ST_08430 [Sphingobium limneticum]
MTFYEEMAELAAEMLEEFGTPGVLVRSGPTISQFDKKLGRNIVTTSAAQRIPVSASVGPVAVKNSEGREVLKSVAVTLSAPVQGDTLEWGDLTYTIGVVTGLPLQGKIVAYMSEVA